MGLPPVQVPFWQVSVWVQALPSLQVVPLAAAGLEHWPVVGSQVPATWQGSSALHTTPAHRSVLVHTPPLTVRPGQHGSVGSEGAPAGRQPPPPQVGSPTAT